MTSPNRLTMFAVKSVARRQNKPSSKYGQRNLATMALVLSEAMVYVGTSHTIPATELTWPERSVI